MVGRAGLSGLLRIGDINLGARCISLCVVFLCRLDESQHLLFPGKERHGEAQSDWLSCFVSLRVMRQKKQTAGQSREEMGGQSRGWKLQRLAWPSGRSGL